MHPNKIKILQPMTAAHIAYVPQGSGVLHLRNADMTRIMSRNAIHELVQQLRRAGNALTRLGPGEGMFVYCKQGCNRTPVWCISFLMAKTGEPLSTCSKHYIDMRSLTWLDFTARSFLTEHESALRGAFNSCRPPRLTYPLPMVLEEDSWNKLAQAKATQGNASILCGETCHKRFKKQKLDDDDDVIDFMPPLEPR